jgi:phosphoglycerate dehydrogenase-like enzyme
MKLSGLIVMYPNAAEEVYGDELRVEIESRVTLLAGVLSAEALAIRPDLLEQAEVIFSGWGAPLMDETFLEKATRLRAVFYAAGTVRSWVTDAVWQRNLVVATASAANAIPVADYASATILFSLKKGWYYALSAKRLGRHAPRVSCAGGFRSKVGFVSLGLVARLVCERLRTSDLELFAFDPHVSPEQAAALGVKLVGLEEIFRECDVVSAHTPLLPATRGLIGAEHFSAMKNGATFINTARGEIVREDELIETLVRRDDLTAVLDVTHPEPPVEGSLLYTLPNVVLTPHIAGSLGAESRRLGRAMIIEFKRWIAGEPLHWQLTREKAALSA